MTWNQSREVNRPRILTKVLHSYSGNQSNRVPYPVNVKLWKVFIASSKMKLFYSLHDEFVYWFRRSCSQLSLALHEHIGPIPSSVIVIMLESATRKLFMEEVTLTLSSHIHAHIHAYTPKHIRAHTYIHLGEHRNGANSNYFATDACSVAHKASVIVRCHKCGKQCRN